jgi:signal transduction histidine kinase
MKKHYIRYGTVFCILVLLVFLIVFGIYTGNKVKEFNSEFKLAIITTDIDYHDENTDGHLEKAVAESWDYYEKNKTEYSGFCSWVKDVRSGEIILDYAEYAGDAETEKLSDEARKICDEAEQYYINHKYYNNKSGVFTSTYGVLSPSGNGNIYVAYGVVAKPLKNVLKTNVMTYIVILSVFLFVEAAVVISFVVLYRNQMNYEIRNQKLTRGIAHELKTPLAVTKATVENWDYFDEDRRKDYSQRIKTEVDHMSDMVDKLIEVSKIKEGSSKPNCKDVDMRLLAGDIIDSSKELIRERNITVTFNHDGKPYMVYADPDMIRIVIGNFMSNAVKYCDHIIMIRLVRDGRKIEFSITNDGDKIEKEDLDKVWDIFYTTDKARTDRMSNSGVGLSVVRSILDAHKAEYGCTSGDNGTEFKFTLSARESA